MNYLQQVTGANMISVNIVFTAVALPAGELPSLYQAVDAFVLPSRGEGWGRPLMEAMANGLPTIGTRWSGNLEFMNDENSFLVDCDVVPVSDDAVDELPHFCGHCWAEPSVTHLRQQLRRVYEERTEGKMRGGAARQTVAERYVRARVGRLILDRWSRLPASWLTSRLTMRRRGGRQLLLQLPGKETSC